MLRPVIAIVGRPNVGKSTLFNRIVGGRAAIVDDQPGVTRDRKYAEGEWAGRHFTLVDTGGYLPGSENKIEKAVFEQVDAVIGEADLLIFLLDGKTGVTALDKEIALLLKRSGREILVTVNKIDNAKEELNCGEFYELGLGDLVSISAVQGRKIGDFLDAVMAASSKRKQGKSDESTETVALAVVGRPNVGKSSFINALLGEEKQIVTDIPGTTRDSNDTVFKYHNQVFTIIDTAGLRKKAKVRDSVEFYSTVRSLQSIKRCDIAILVLDAISGLETQDMRILHEALDLNKGVVIMVNKWDLVEKDENTAKEFEKQIREKLKNVNYLPILFVSALTKQRIFKVIDVAKSVDEERGKTIKTSTLNKFLSDVTRRYSPPSMERREVKINYCTQVKSNPPVISFFTNAPAAIKPNYRSYLENQLRQKFGFFGVPLSLVFRKK